MTNLRSPFTIVPFAVYSMATGEIRYNGRVPAGVIDAQDVRSGEALIEGELPFDKAYVDITGASPVGKVRPTFPAFDKLAIKADGADAATLDLSVPATVVIDGVAHQVEAEPLCFTADSPGSYALEIEAWPYMPARFIVVAT